MFENILKIYFSKYGKSSYLFRLLQIYDWRLSGELQLLNFANCQGAFTNQAKKHYLARFFWAAEFVKNAHMKSKLGENVLVLMNEIHLLTSEMLWIQ